MSLVPVLSGSMNWQAWRPTMMNYLLSQGQWKVNANKFPAPDYDTMTTVTKSDEGGTQSEMVADTSKPPKNQSEIDSWFDTNDKALGNIMLRLHPTLATTVLNLLEKTIAENTDVNTMFASIAWEYLEATYGKPGIAATYKELKMAMDIVIPGNTDPTLAIDTILVGFTRMAASKCAVPSHLQAMILVSKLPYQMSALVQSICQTDNIEDLKTDDIKRKAILAWEQRSPVQGQNNRQQSARRLSAVQRPGPPPQFQQQQQEEQDQGQGQRGNWQGGWRGNRGRGGRGMYRGTRAGKNKNQQEQARPIESEEHQRATSPTPSFHFGEIASVLTTPEPFVPRSIYLNFSNALSLAHRLGVKPTTETVKTLEVYERAKENAARPSKRPRVNSEEEVDIYWTSDEEDVNMFLHNSAAGPSSRCALTASPLEATDPSFTGYNTTPATSNTTRVVPYVNDEFCCPLLSELDAEENLNKVSWILDSGASLHYTGDINDFIEYAPLEKPIKAATATTTSTDIIGVGMVLMTIEGSEHMICVAPVYFVPDLSSCLLSLGVFLRHSGFTTKGDNQHIAILQDGQDFITFYPRNVYSTVYTVDTYLGAKPSIRAAEEIFSPDYETYHHRLAHPSKEVLQKAGKYVKGFPSNIQIPLQHICPGCEQGKQIDQVLQDVGVTPSQRQGMRVPPPRTLAWQDRPPTPDNIKGKQRQTIQVEDVPSERPPSSLPLPLPRKRQPAALPPPCEKSTRVKKVPERYTDSNVYGEKHPVQVEKAIKRQKDWRKVVGEESSRPRRQAIPGGVPVPDSVPYYSSGEEDSGSGSEGEVDDALGSPSSSGDEKMARLSREGGVAFYDFLISKAVVTPKEKGPKEWTYKDVMGLPAGQLEEWRAACQREIETLLKRNVFDIVECPSGRRVIKNCWVFDVKPDGRKRARLVAKGFSQVEGMDFDQIFSPVVRFETVRLILALAALEGWYTSGLDVRNTYLYGELDEEIYMEQPEGFHAKGMERGKHVLRLRRALYGLKQAGLAWWRVLKKSMEELGFVNLDSDAGLFMCLDEASQTFVVAVIYVDDAIFLGPKKPAVDTMKQRFMKRWESQDLGELTEFLHMRIGRAGQSIYLDQAQYLQTVLERCGMQNAKAVPTPLPAGYAPTKSLDKAANPELRSRYQTVIGSLLYLMLGTRPDISFAVTKMAQFAANPTEDHLKHALYICRYLIGTPNYRLTYNGAGGQGLSACTDSDWASDVNT